MRKALILMGLCAVLTMAQAECARIYRVWGSTTGSGQRIISPELELLLADLGCRYEVVDARLAQPRLFRQIEDGQIDITAEASQLPEREAIAWFSLPYRIQRVRFFALPTIAAAYPDLNINELPHPRLRVVLPPAGWFGPGVARLREQVTGSNPGLVTDKLHSAAANISAGRLDVIVSLDSALPLLRDIEPRLQAFGNEIYADPVCLMFAKKTVTPAEVEQFNAAIRKRYPAAMAQ